MKQMKITINKKRHTKEKRVLTDKLNLKKINSSSRANYIHAHDSALVRYCISIRAILSIHDCFLIDYRSVSFLIALAIDAMRKSFHDLGLNKSMDISIIYSIFILI